MPVLQLIESRRDNWRELSRLCNRLQGLSTRQIPAADLTRFAALYRAACADRALADAYQLPPDLIDALDRLVARAHNLLYRTPPTRWEVWLHLVLRDAPRRIFRDRCVQFVMLAFWLVLGLALLLARSETLWPDFAADLLTEQQLTRLETDFAERLEGFSEAKNLARAGFYIRNNAGIGLKCFALGILIVPGMLITLHNAAMIGASFGHMASLNTDARDHFFEFVTAHAPFELTAIALSAGAGLRLGLSWMQTDGWTRSAGLKRGAERMLPVAAAAVVLFILAAFIEAFVSPSALPYAAKAGVAIVSTLLLLVYFLVLGSRR